MNGGVAADAGRRREIGQSRDGVAAVQSGLWELVGEKRRLVGEGGDLGGGSLRAGALERGVGVVQVCELFAESGEHGGLHRICAVELSHVVSIITG